MIPTTTTRWWQRRLAAIERVPRLAGAVLGGRYVRYALHRLRGYALARGVGAALFVVEAVVLLEVLPPRIAIIAFVASHAAGLANGFWWGATEAQRIAIRASAQDADRITATWLWWAFALGGCTIAVTGGLAISWREQPVAAAYAIVLGLRVATDLPLRVRHSRISARWRIRRWMWLQVPVEAIGPVVVLALHHEIGPSGFLAAMAASSIASRALTWYSIRHAHRAARIVWVRPARGRAAPLLTVLGLGIAGVATRIPSALGMMFLALPGLPLTVAIGFNMTVGALSAAGGWAWSHYQDFVGLADPALRRARERIEWMVVVEAIAVGLAVGAAVLAIVYTCAPRSLEVGDPGVAVLIPPKFADPWRYAFALPAIAVGLSALAAVQVIAWTRGAFVAVAASGAIASLALGCAAPIANHLLAAPGVHEIPVAIVRVGHVMMGGAAGACAIALWIVARHKRSPQSPGILWPIARQRAELAPGTVTVITSIRAGGFTDPFVAHLSRAGATWWSRRGRSWLVAGLTPEALAALVVACGGMLADLVPYVPVITAPPPDRGVCHRFRLDRAVSGGTELTDHQLQRIWRALIHHLDGGRPRDVSVFDVELDGDAVVALAARFHGDR